MKITQFAQPENASRVCDILNQLPKTELMELAIACGLKPPFCTKSRIIPLLIGHLHING